MIVHGVQLQKKAYKNAKVCWISIQCTYRLEEVNCRYSVENNTRMFILIQGNHDVVYSCVVIHYYADLLPTCTASV